MGREGEKEGKRRKKGRKNPLLLFLAATKQLHRSNESMESARFFFLFFFLSFLLFFFTIRNQSTSLMATHNRGFVAPGRAHNAKEAWRKKKKENLNVFLCVRNDSMGGDTSYSDTRARFFFISIASINATAPF